jgi:CxxC-x17-CxxC domain-containing protein
MPDFQDRVLKCIDCGTDFVFTAGEQRFYHEKDFQNEPKRCKTCKTKRQSGPSEKGGPRGRVETAAVCSGCGRETTIPFKPTQGRPVFCRDCFKDRKAASASV